MTRKSILLSVIVGIGFFFGASQASAIPVDLFSFDLVDPTVSIFGPNSSSATITEDPYVSPVGLVAYGLPIPSDALTLTFDYVLEVEVGNADFFDFYFGSVEGFFSGIPGDESFGGSAALSRQVFAGSLSFDLTSFAGSTLPLAFALNSDFFGGDEGLNSVLTISNVQINPVPEPATLLLMSAGLAGLMGLRRKIRL
jgi:hypothetical protein